MDVTKHNKYKIKMTDSKFQCIEANGRKGVGFVYPDSGKKLPKIYVVRNGHEIYYVSTFSENGTL